MSVSKTTWDSFNFSSRWDTSFDYNDTNDFFVGQSPCEWVGSEIWWPNFDSISERAAILSKAGSYIGFKLIFSDDNYFIDTHGDIIDVPGTINDDWLAVFSFFTLIIDYAVPEPTITLSSPNVGESWQLGETKNISWSSGGSPGSHVKIDLYKGGTLDRTLTNSTSNDGSYSFSIPESLALGADYQIEVTSTTNSLYVDRSDSYFSITDLDVISPNGGENWEAGTSHDISWVSSNGTGPDVIIALYKNGEFVYEIAQESNDGMYSWTIPLDIQIGTDYKIRVWTIGAEDLSDSSFTIVEGSHSPIVSNPNPSDGATVTAGGSGQLLRVKAGGATSGKFYYDINDDISFSTVNATVNGDYLEAIIPYDPGDMTNDGTNYWYVKATSSIGTSRYPSTGTLSFTVTPALPVVSNPNPSDGATVAVGGSGQLLRVKAVGATSGKFYYDINDDISFSTVNASVNGDYLEAIIPYDPGDMTNDGTNYWYVKATSSVGTSRYPSTGTLSFTVTPTVILPLPTISPSPSNKATNVSMNIILSWSNGGEATSYDVYFGTNISPGSTEYKFNTSSTTFIPGSLAYDTTYYWRIDSRNSHGTTEGNVWQFTSQRECNLSDALTVLQILVGQNPEHEQLPCYNVNGDGQIGIEELVYILQAVSGLRNTTPPGTEGAVDVGLPPPEQDPGGEPEPDPGDEEEPPQEPEIPAS